MAFSAFMWMMILDGGQPIDYSRIKCLLADRYLTEWILVGKPMGRTAFLYFKLLVGTSVADPGCLSRILDPTFFHPGSRIRAVFIPDPGSASKNLSILLQKKPKKNGFQALENMIRVVHPGSRIRMLTFYPSRIPDPRSRGQKDTGSWIPDPGSGSPTLVGTGTDVYWKLPVPFCRDR
jgi:hypothetical protein